MGTDCLSFFNSCKYVFSFIKTNKLKFIITFIVTLITFTSLGLVISSLKVNPNKTHLNLLYENEISDTILFSNNQIKAHLLYPASPVNFRFTDKQIQTIKKSTNQDDLIYVYDGLSASALGKDKIQIIDYSYIGPTNGYLEMTENELDYAEFSLDQRITNPSICHFPKEYNEIALTSFKANLYLETGLKRNDGTIKKINSINDLIGETLDKYTITAIYENEEDISKINSILNKQSIDLSTKYISNCFILKKGTIDKLCKDNEVFFMHNIGVYYKLPSSISSALSLIKELKYHSRINEYTQAEFEDVMYYYDTSVFSPLISIVNDASSYKYTNEYTIAIALTIIFSIINIIMFTTLVNSNIRKNSTILTITKGNFYTISLLENIFICIINLILSSIIVLLIFHYINKIMQCKFFIYNFSSFLLLIMSSIIINFISIIFSMYRNRALK